MYRKVPGVRIPPHPPEADDFLLHPEGYLGQRRRRNPPHPRNILDGSQASDSCKEALFVRKLGARHDASYESYRTYIDTRPPEIVANILICLIHQTNYLLDQQIRSLEKEFLAEGGLRERMTRARLDARRKQGGAP